MIKIALCLAACLVATVGVVVGAEYREPANSKPELMQDKSFAARGPEGKATIVSEPENALAAELLGTWEWDAEVVKRLGADGNDEEKQSRLTFRVNAESAKVICAKMEADVAKGKEGHDKAKYQHMGEAMRTVYLAGELEQRVGDKIDVMPFALVTWRGNPFVLVNLKSGDVDELAGFVVMLARDADGDKDILFAGADSSRSDFKAFKRVTNEDGGK